MNDTKLENKHGFNPKAKKPKIKNDLPKNLKPNQLLVQVNKPFSGYGVGRKVKIKCDDNGVPLEQFWRNRLKDSINDKCCEILETNINLEKKQNDSFTTT